MNIRPMSTTTVIMDGAAFLSFRAALLRVGAAIQVISILIGHESRRESRAAAVAELRRCRRAGKFRERDIFRAGVSMRLGIRTLRRPPRRLAVAAGETRR
jgi:hypothetical protein